MTLKQIIYDVKEMFSVYSDDTLLSDEHLAFMVNTKRAAYLRNYISNLRKEVPAQAKQLICLNLVHDELCETDVLFLRSEFPVPATIESTGRSNITEAYLNSRLAKWINIVEYQRIPYLSHGRFNNNQIYIALDPNNYLILLSNSGNHELIQELKLYIVAEDPEEADRFSCDVRDNEICDFYDKPYPCELSMINDIKREMLNELIIKYKVPVDVINDSEDNTVNKNPLEAYARRTTK